MDNKKYKLIAFDIDGTILDGHHRVCERLKVVVKQLKQQGYKFTIASARFPDSALAIAKALNLDASDNVIALNGGLIINFERQIIYGKTFDCSNLNNHLDKISPQIAVNYFHNFSWYVNKPNSVTDYELSLNGIYGQSYKLGELATANKITLMGETNELHQARDILSGLNDNLLLAFSHPNYVEVATSDISKYTGLVAYTQQLNISMDEVIAFGDGENDIEMLSGVGLGVAMANASDYVKSFAKDIAPHHLEQGVARYLEQLIAQNIL
jgi:Cof subfamily protein (haloacid dehalogenase superfamily)